MKTTLHMRDNITCGLFCETLEIVRRLDHMKARLELATYRFHRRWTSRAIYEVHVQLSVALKIPCRRFTPPSLALVIAEALIYDGSKTS